MNEAEKLELLTQLSLDRVSAHEVLFSHRHKDKTPGFHREILELFYSPDPLVAAEAFRGAAKSTLLEEYILLSVLFQDFMFPIIVGNNWGSACSRLAPIKQELVNNDKLVQLFGDQVASPWTEDIIGFSNGAKIQALGARQSMRGVKHNDERPDLAAVDDLEDEENVHTEEARRKNDRWLNGVLRPALNPKNGKIRMVGTPLHPQAIIERKMTDPSWKTKRFPVCFIDDDGAEQSSWPDRFSMDYINNLRRDYAMSGNMIEFEQEYMCRAEDAAAKPFQARMIKVETPPVNWLPVEVMIDPARTVSKRAARTGYAAWSWMGNKLVVREAYGEFHKPDEIINEIFKLNEQFNPVHIGVEADGLEEFIMQPLRAEQIKRGVSVPILPVRAPRDKNAFITSLQPFYMAGDVVHVKDFPDLNSELLQFPTGRVDVPNALAYALRLRAGRTVYDDFTFDNVVEDLGIDRRETVWLGLNTRPAMTGAVLFQYIDGAFRVYKDWVRNEPIMECIESVVQAALMHAGRRIDIVVSVDQFDKYMSSGVTAALKKVKMQSKRSGSSLTSEGKLTPWLRKNIRGVKGLICHEDARWCVNGFARGYGRRMTPGGVLMDKPEDNQYRLVIEILESFAAWFDILQVDDDTPAQKQYAYTKDGRRYITTMTR